MMIEDIPICRNYHVSFGRYTQTLLDPCACERLLMRTQAYHAPTRTFHFDYILAALYTKHQGTAQRAVTHSTISNNKNVYTKNPTSVLRFVWFPPFLLFLFVAPFVCVHVVRTCIICMYCMCVVWLCWHMQLLCSVLNSYWQSRADGYFLQFIYIYSYSYNLVRYRSG